MTALERPPIPLEDERWALFLDFDGTLCPLVAHPDHVRVPVGTSALLRRLDDRMQRALCVLSGRPLSELCWHLRNAPHVDRIGGHGAEDPLADGASRRIDATRLGEAMGRLQQRMDPLMVEAEGAWLEWKAGGVALHVRQCAEPSRVMEAMQQAIDGEPLFRALRGNAVLEAAETLGGFGIVVGSRRPTRARFALEDVDAVARWLDGVAAAYAAVQGGGRRPHPSRQAAMKLPPLTCRT